MWTVFKVFIKFVSVFVFCFYVSVFLAMRRVRFYLPDQGSNLHLLHWKVKS